MCVRGLGFWIYLTRFTCFCLFTLMKCLSNLHSVRFDNGTSQSPGPCDLPGSKCVITFLDVTQRMVLCKCQACIHVCVLICLVSVLIILIMPLASICATVALACVQNHPHQTFAHLYSCMHVGRNVGEHYQGWLGHAGAQRSPRGLC